MTTILFTYKFLAGLGTDIYHHHIILVCAQKAPFHTNVRLFILSLAFLCAFVLNLAFYLQHS